MNRATFANGSPTVIVMVTSGILLFRSEALKCYYSPAFWTKTGELSILAKRFWIVANWNVFVIE